MRGTTRRRLEFALQRCKSSHVIHFCGARMRLFLLILVTMIAFAANSVLTRMGLAEGRIGPAAFSAIRLA